MLRHCWRSTIIASLSSGITKGRDCYWTLSCSPPNGGTYDPNIKSPALALVLFSFLARIHIHRSAICNSQLQSPFSTYFSEERTCSFTTMSSRIVARMARARPTEEETRLAALASIAARRARIAAATAKLEVPASKPHLQFAPLPTRRQARSPAPPRLSEELWTDANLCELLLLLWLEKSLTIYQFERHHISKGPPHPDLLDKLRYPSELAETDQTHLGRVIWWWHQRRLWRSINHTGDLTRPTTQSNGTRGRFHATWSAANGCRERADHKEDCVSEQETWLA